MDDLKSHISNLFTAELQFRLASAVRLATTLQCQPLDLPMEWTHGQHRVQYSEIALREDQADFAADFLHRSATYLMAVAIKDAIRAAETDPKNSRRPEVQAAYQIARLIRNAFAHAPFAPTWSIDLDCRDKEFSIPNLITLNTSGLHGTPFDWRQYGGPLALFRLCQFARVNILKDEPTPRSLIPLPQKRIYQQGSLLLHKIDEIPKDAVRVDVDRLPDGSFPLGEGHFLRPSDGD